MDIKRSIENGERRFNQLSIEERGKFDEETLVNVNSIRRQKTSNQIFKGFSNEYIVVCTVPLFLAFIISEKIIALVNFRSMSCGVIR